MTKEELKEAIAATITENGNKGITGQALANLLNEIVDAAGEGGGGAGSGGNILSLDLKLDAETSEPIPPLAEEILPFRQTLIEGLTNNKPYIVFINSSASMSGDLGGATGYIYMAMAAPATYQYLNIPDVGVDELTLMGTSDDGLVTKLLINSDGSTTITIEDQTTESTTE